MQLKESMITEKSYSSTIFNFGLKLNVYLTIGVYCYDFVKDFYVTAAFDHHIWTNIFFLWFSLFSPFALVFILYADRSLKKTFNILFGFDDLATLSKDLDFK